MTNQDNLAGVREGDTLAGKYRIDKILGVGGMGVVVAAHHIALDERVAIKFMLPAVLHNREAVGRFAREARAAVKIKSEHVVRVSDVGTLENGAPYMVMEYLEGGDLAAWLQNRGALPVEQAVDYLLQACEAIAEAHALGIVHRDLKPANLMVVRRPDGTQSVKVLDFGISKATKVGSAGDSDSLTRTSALMGSPLYMSPEQMQSSKNADARSDIWALGVILYELLTANTPFSGETMPELILQVLNAPHRPLRDGRPDAPSGIEAVIGKCLEKDRGRRYQTVGELAVALLPFAPKRSKLSVERISGVMQIAGMSASALALPPSSAGEAAAASASSTMGTFAGTLSAPKGSKRWAVGAVAAIGIVSAVAFSLSEPSRPEPEGPGSASPVVTTAPPTAQGTPPPPAALSAEVTVEPATAASAPAPSASQEVGPATKPVSVARPLVGSIAKVPPSKPRSQPAAISAPPTPKATPPAPSAPQGGRRMGGRL